MKIRILKSLSLLILVIFFACNHKKENKASDTVKIATLRGPSAISMVKMLEDLKNIGDDSIAFQVKNEPLQIRPLLLQEKVDFAVVPTNMASILYNKDVPYKVAAIPVWGTLYLFGQDTSITSWNDLKGKTIHLMAKGMTPDVMFRYLLTKNGLNPVKDVNLNYSFPTHIELANAVASGKAKLGVISEPLVSMVIQKNSAVQSIFSINEEWKQTTGLEVPQTSLLVNKSFASENRKFTNDFLTEYKKSVEWVKNNKEQASMLIVKHKILNDKHVAYNSIPRCNLNFKTAHETKALINKYLQIFYDMNPDIVGGKIPDEGFYYKK